MSTQLVKKWHIIGKAVEADKSRSAGVQEFYLASEADARIAELEKALRVLWHEVKEAGLADAKDYNWPEARDLTIKALGL